MRKAVLFLSVLASLGLGAQKISLTWDKSQVVDYGFTKRTYPKFTNDGYDADGLNVYIKYKGKSGGKRFSIANQVWTKTSELYDLTSSQLPEGELSGINYYTDSKSGEEFFNAKVATFKKEKNQVYRLESFDLVPEIQQPTAARNKAIAARDFTTENPLASGTFYKIKVDKSGIFKIDKNFLLKNNIPVSNPKNLRIYGNGGVMLPEYNGDFRYPGLQENAIQVVGEEDGKWDDGDYALFYAQGPHGFNLFDGPNKRTETRTDRSKHVQNIYDDFSYYFITFDKGAGKRVPTVNSDLAGEAITRYDDYQFIDEDKTNLVKLGRVWVADPFTSEKKITFTTKTPLRAEDPVYYRASVGAYKSGGNSISSNINGQQNYTQSISTGSKVDLEKLVGFTGETTGISGNTITISVTPSLSANPNGSFYFDYAEVMYRQDLTFSGDQMTFRDYSISEPASFSVGNASSVEQIWDVSDITNAKRVTNKSGNNATFNFGYNPTEGFKNEFVAFKSSAAFAPTFVGKIATQNLAGNSGVDYLIITRKDMLGEAERLAKFHRGREKFNVLVADVDEIYNEYSSGSRDITAIRDFISDLKNNKGGLKYVTIIGDSSYDYKNKTAGNDNVVPAYESEFSGDVVSSFISDDYFVMTNPQTRTSIQYLLPDIPIGRLLASNVAQAKVMVDKTLAYNNALSGQSSPFGEWRMKLDFVADDDNDDKISGSPDPILNGNFHDVVDYVIRNNFEKENRNEYNIRKLYLDAYPAESSAGGQRYPQVNQAIATDMNNSLYMFYFGHGGINGWAQERVLTLDDIKNFNNYNAAFTHFPFVSTITCEFTLWDDPAVNSAGEQLIKHKSGGAATMITSSRAVGVGYGRKFTDTFTNNIFELDSNNEFLPLGDAHLKAKKEYGADSNHLKVNFLGDPAMKLSRPKQTLVIDNIESDGNGTLRALDKVKVTGHIPDDNFNGRVSINIYDKKITKKTRNNDGNLTPVLEYKEEPSAIVKASGKAENGKFTVEFYMPRDINYTVGQGRILAYADNFESAKANAYDVFQTQPVSVGDINPNGINDSEPPKIGLFMNNTNFADGGITDANPVLLACLTDNTGINSTGAGIGHDITIVLDGEVINTTVLNDYFSAGGSNGCISSESLQDYQKGSVTYPLKNLKPGAHQLVFKVWDINNNSSTATLNFVVKDEADQKLVLNRLLNWPNPFTDKTYIQFEHNCDGVLDVNAQIYTITGKLVRTLSQSVSAEPFLQGYRTPKTAIMWDGKDDYGATVGKGTYIFKVFARALDQEKCKGSATAVEKMVLLK